MPPRTRRCKGYRASGHCEVCFAARRGKRNGKAGVPREKSPEPEDLPVVMVSVPANGTAGKARFAHALFACAFLLVFLAAVLRRVASPRVAGGFGRATRLGARESS